MKRGLFAKLRKRQKGKQALTKPNPSDLVFNTIDITDVKTMVDQYYPENWPYLEACLAASATLYIDDIKDPASLILVGPPSGGKGTTLDALKGHSSTYWSDNFTAASFVTQVGNVSKEKLESIDLLPRIKNKTLIVPELAPLFNQRHDKLSKTIATLTRVFDGEGYTLPMLEPMDNEVIKESTVSHSSRPLLHHQKKCGEHWPSW